MKTFVAFAVGFGAGWAVRSIAESPHGVGVKVMEVACRAKDQVNRWFAGERERLSDMLAEAKSRTDQGENYEQSDSLQNAA